ncbi:plasmid pRiA4b ORF-3 family protein [Actinomadura fibrosa]|uniref:Plasmid pRiA4b ORF-3 family protein n=1 Tax=Actinomadura fibrosa TaxID=111802 RepID=A0ABW2XET4_9ACTN|nr:plasmid pRiA4b ORF-3 family protein [Actinomadura fibrosa]
MRIFRLEITLLDMEKPVRRTVEVPADTTLSDLYYVIQAAMGWDFHSHMHVFETHLGRFGVADGELGIEDAAHVTLEAVAPRFGYVHDFGDDWQHDVRVTGDFSAEPGVDYPRVVDGTGACPPEDSGGPPGFAAMLDALADPSHDDHEMYMEWTDGGFDPDAFDLDRANRRLRAGTADLGTLADMD